MISSRGWRRCESVARTDNRTLDHHSLHGNPNGICFATPYVNRAGRGLPRRHHGACGYHRGLYPPAPNPIKAWYLFIDSAGMHFVRESAYYDNRKYCFNGALPGELRFSYFEKRGYGGFPVDENETFTPPEPNMGFVFGHQETARNAFWSRFLWITIPRWFV